jgi:hypothetical protein
VAMFGSTKRVSFLHAHDLLLTQIFRHDKSLSDFKLNVLDLRVNRLLLALTGSTGKSYT